VPIGGMCVRQPLAIGGSGSTYVYGYVDAHFKTDMTKKECLEFVTNSMYQVPKEGMHELRCTVEIDLLY